MINVVIADDHRIVAEGIARLIQESHAASVVGIAGTIAEAVALIRQQKPHILLLDIAMTDGDGIDAIPRFRQACPQLSIVILTCYAEPSVIHRAMQAGANGYLLKNVSAEEFSEGLTTVIGGQTYMCIEARALLSTMREVSPALTNREREILQLIVQGYTIKEIADKLYLGFETVHSYTKSLRQKLGCNNSTSLVRIAIERHLV